MKKITSFFTILLSLACAYVAQAQTKPQAAAESVPVPAGATVPACVVDPFSIEDLPVLRSKDLEIIHAKTPFAGFLVRVGERIVAVGAVPSTIGYVRAGELRWFQPADGQVQKQSVVAAGNTIQVAYASTDKDGGVWEVKRSFRPEPVPGAIEVQTDISVNQERSVAFLPMLLVFPGVGSFGGAKSQGLFAGLEYLENEPSSSEADVVGPAARRQVPDNLKITFPLMAIQNNDRYVALSWQMRPSFGAVFDSPDRLFGSGGHVMGLLFPGSDGRNREEGSLLPRKTEVLRPGQTLTLRASIIGGMGASVVPAVQEFLRRRHLPPKPGGLDLTQYALLTAGGWLDSKIREGNLIRHALAGGGFKPQAASDAAIWMEWLATQVPAPVMVSRLRETAANLVSIVPGPNLNESGVGHIRYPVASLIFGHVAETAEQAEHTGKGLLASFQADGSVEYHPALGKPDFAKTHFTNEASGLASRAVVDLLENASFSGDPELLEKALSCLRALQKFHNGVPRGAQTWECPLHTPDILASAQMVRAYTFGFELTGDVDFLEEARYWAWTGLPFVYLVNPTDQPVGLYATIPVFGATQWQGPVWLGLPVQWCGLVYADALYRLVRDDPQGPWKQIADGITVSGMQQSWTRNDADFQGLLPDSFVLREQKRNGPAINPATLQACAARYFGSIPVYDFQSFRLNRLLVHAPGEIKLRNESKGHLDFEVQSWVDHPYFVLVNGLTRKPALMLNEHSIECSAPHQFLEKEGRLILNVQGRSSVKLDL